MRFAAYLILGGLSLAAMAWSAVPPDRDPTRELLQPSREALSDWAAWFRSGPVDGKPDWEEAARNVYDADPDNGARLMTELGCGGCHVIPGIAGANGTVGPSLHGFARRAYVAGVLPNEPGGVTRWLMNPPAQSPQTAMPKIEMTEEQARDMTAYLMTLRGS